MPPPLAKKIVSPVLIGREPERDALHYLIAQARDTSGKAVLIAGEAGIGKSRLVGEAVTAALAQGFRVLQGHCFETDRSLPYAPLLDLLRPVFTARQGADLRRALGHAADGLAPLLPEIALLEQGRPGSPEPGPEAAKRLAFGALRDVIFYRAQNDHEAGAPDRPLLIAIEDLHWSDDLSLEFLLYFTRQISTQPVLLLLTYRSDEVRLVLNHFLAAFDRERLAVEWMLRPLGLEETEQMIRAIFEQPRMHYDQYRAAGLPIGSGTVESAATTLVHLRLKRPGRGWCRDNAQAMLAALSELNSDRFDLTWRTISAAHP